MDRKTFFKKAFTLAVGKGLTLLENTPVMKAIEKLEKEAEDSTSNRRIKQRPPGTLPEREFLQTCTGCDACMIACPVNVIMIEDMESRLPLIYPLEAPCISCEGYPCIKSCPTGALSGNSDKVLKIFNS